MNVLVVGGAGYIGSHMVKELLRAGHSVVIADNFSTGFRSAIVGGAIAELDIANCVALDALFATYRIDSVMHFASLIEVGQSIAAPDRYYANNVDATRVLLGCMANAGVSQIIFSSSAAVYGNPDYLPIDEHHRLAPTNPYGHTKQLVEHMLGEFERTHGIRSICLRYFNAAGADPDGELGERHYPETHLIPLTLQVAAKRQPALSVFGRDYDTPDRTCVRDYVHVSDLVAAHLLALKFLRDTGKSEVFNLGAGAGYSVQEIVQAARRVTGRPINIVDCARRAGDPPSLIADAGFARRVLGWNPRFSSLDTILEHAWAWELRRPWD